MLPSIKLVKSNGKIYNLNEYNGYNILIVNTATKCGFAYQFNELEILYKKYKDKKFIVLAFPCNQFANQEPINDKDMVSSCQINFGVTFPLHKKCDVNGKNEHEIFTWLKKEKPGILGKKIKWNFTKFLINNKGEVIKRYSANTKIKKIEKDLKKLL